MPYPAAPAPEHPLQVIADQHIAVRNWDGQRVVFDRRSGDSHLLNELGCALMAELAHGPLVPETLCNRSIRSFGLEPDEELLAAARSALDHLMQIGFVGPVLS